MSGWFNNSKYVFLGALCFTAQIVFYVVSIVFVFLQISDVFLMKKRKVGWAG